MNQYEEELQKNIDAGTTPIGDELDIKAYQEVFIRLTQEPEIYLSSNFADSIVARVIEKRRRAASGDFLWFGLGILFLVIAFIIAIMLSGFKFNLGFLKEMSAYTGLFVFGVIFILILNRLDKQLVRNSPLHH